MIMIKRSMVDGIKTSMNFRADKYGSLLGEKFKRNKKSQIKNLLVPSGDLADLDQYGRRLNLEIHGLKVGDDPKEKNLAAVLQNVAKDISVNYKPSHLQPRREGKPPTVIIQYYTKIS
ncbi:hypothetical protein J6590_051087 [Homalodisca vitripennis]|nr:hypothetical protein J6590_051087 [Homalodisca vitripennis]